MRFVFPDEMTDFSERAYKELISKMSSEKISDSLINSFISMKQYPSVEEGQRMALEIQSSRRKLKNVVSFLEDELYYVDYNELRENGIKEALAALRSEDV